MDETKLIELLNDHLNKTDALLEDKINKMENKIENSLKEIRNEIETIKMNNQTAIVNISNTLSEVEKSQNFINKEYESQKGKINDLIKDNKKLFLENQQLKNELDDLYQNQEDNKSDINKLAQYNRSSFMIEIAGIPRKKNEDTLYLVEKLAVAAKVDHFDKNQIDVAHRTSGNMNAPIIVMFNKKKDRLNFYSQKKKLVSIKPTDIVDSGVNNHVDDDDEVSLPGLTKINHIFVNESLTRTNRILLKEAKSISKALQYKYPGYTYNGEVRVKKSDNSEYIAINCKKDLDKIT